MSVCSYGAHSLYRLVENPYLSILDLDIEVLIDAIEEIAKIDWFDCLLLGTTRAGASAVLDKLFTNPSQEMVEASQAFMR